MQYLYKPGEYYVKDAVVRNDDGVLVCQISGDPVAELLVDGYGIYDSDFVTEMTASAAREKFIGKWDEITADEFDEALNCLPPQKWERSASGEMFRMCEYTYINITTHYCRIDDRYFRANREAVKDYSEYFNEVSQMMKPVESLQCAVCGSSCKGRQWHNRDNGFGLCGDCYQWCKKTGDNDESIRSDYGIKGIHFEA